MMFEGKGCDKTKLMDFVMIAEVDSPLGRPFTTASAI
jgi:hypothetical protein